MPRLHSIRKSIRSLRKFRRCAIWKHELKNVEWKSVFLHNDEKLHSWKLQNFRENKFAVKRKSFPRLSVNLVVGVEK